MPFDFRALTLCCSIAISLVQTQPTALAKSRPSGLKQRVLTDSWLKPTLRFVPGGYLVIRTYNRSKQPHRVFDHGWGCFRLSVPGHPARYLRLWTRARYHPAGTAFDGFFPYIVLKPGEFLQHVVAMNHLMARPRHGHGYQYTVSKKYGVKFTGSFWYEWRKRLGTGKVVSVVEVYDDGSGPMAWSNAVPVRIADIPLRSHWYPCRPGAKHWVSRVRDNFVPGPDRRARAAKEREPRNTSKNISSASDHHNASAKSPAKSVAVADQGAYRVVLKNGRGDGYGMLVVRIYNISSRSQIVKDAFGRFLGHFRMIASGKTGRSFNLWNRASLRDHKRTDWRPLQSILRPGQFLQYKVPIENLVSPGTGVGSSLRAAIYSRQWRKWIGNATRISVQAVASGLSGQGATGGNISNLITLDLGKVFSWRDFRPCPPRWTPRKKASAVNP